MLTKCFVDCPIKKDRVSPCDDCMDKYTKNQNEKLEIAEVTEEEILEHIDENTFNFFSLADAYKIN